MCKYFDYSVKNAKKQLIWLLKTLLWLPFRSVVWKVCRIWKKTSAWNTFMDTRNQLFHVDHLRSFLWKSQTKISVELYLRAFKSNKMKIHSQEKTPFEVEEFSCWNINRFSELTLLIRPEILYSLVRTKIS